MRFFKKTLALLCALLALAGCSKAAEGEAPSETPLASGGEKTALSALAPELSAAREGFALRPEAWLGENILIATANALGTEKACRIYICHLSESKAHLVYTADEENPPLWCYDNGDAYRIFVGGKRAALITAEKADFSVKITPLKTEFPLAVNKNGLCVGREGDSPYIEDAFTKNRIIIPKSGIFDPISPGGAWSADGRFLALCEADLYSSPAVYTYLVFDSEADKIVFEKTVESYSQSDLCFWYGSENILCFTSFTEDGCAILTAADISGGAERKVQVEKENFLDFAGTTSLGVMLSGGGSSSEDKSRFCLLLINPFDETAKTVYNGGDCPVLARPDGKAAFIKHGEEYYFIPLKTG